MADELKKPNQVSPAINSAQGGSKDQMKMAGTQAAKQGAGIGEYFGVKGNVHEVPDLAETPKEATRTTTERSRMIDKGLETEAARLEAEKIRAQDTITNTSLLTKAGTLGAGMQASIAAKISAAFEKHKADLGATPGEQSDTLGMSVLGSGIMTDAQVSLADAFNAGTATKEEVEAAGVKINPVTGKAINLTTSLNTILTASDPVAIKNAVADFAYANGKVDADGKVRLTVADIVTIFDDGDDKLAKILALAIPDDIKIFDDAGGSSLIGDMGYTESEITDLRALLDLKDDDTVQDFQAKVQKYRDTTFAEIRRMEAQMLDTSLPEGERAYIRERLRDMGYVGALGNRENVEHIARLVDAADENIEFGGETYDTLEDLLSDKKMSGIISEYLKATPEEREEMELPKSLSDMIDANEALFQAAMYEVEEEVKEFVTVQDTAATLSGSGLTRDALVALGFDPDSQYYTDIPKGTAIDAILDKNRDPKEKIVIASVINKGTAAGGAAASNVLNLSIEDLNTLSTDTAASETYTAVVNQYGVVKKLIDAGTDDIKGIDDELGVIETVMGLPAGSLITTIRDLKALEKLGIKLGPEEQAALDLISQYYGLGMKGMLERMEKELNDGTKSVAGALESALRKVSETAQRTSTLLMGKTESITYLTQLKDGKITIDAGDDTAINELKSHIVKTGMYSSKALEDPKILAEALARFDIVQPGVTAVVQAQMDLQEVIGIKDLVGYENVTNIHEFATRLESLGGLGASRATQGEYETVKKKLADWSDNGDLTDAEKATQKKLYQMVVASPNPLEWKEAIHSIRSGFVAPLKSVEFRRPFPGFEMLFTRNTNGRFVLKDVAMANKKLKDIWQDFARLVHNNRLLIPNLNTKEGMADLASYVSAGAKLEVPVYNPKADAYRTTHEGKLDAIEQTFW